MRAVITRIWLPSYLYEQVPVIDEDHTSDRYKGYGGVTFFDRNERGMKVDVSVHPDHRATYLDFPGKRDTYGGSHWKELIISNEVEITVFKP